jgi:hypothetical protein
MDVLWSTDGRLRLICAVLNGYGDERYLRTGESGGGFRSSAENTGQAGGLAYGAGTMALVCLGRSFQPFEAFLPALPRTRECARDHPPRNAWHARRAAPMLPA